MSFTPYDFMDNNDKNTKKTGTAGVSNTPAVNTAKNTSNACVDWLTCSFSFTSDVHQIFYLIGIEDLSLLEVKKGSRYEFALYDTTYKIGQIELMHYVNDVYNDCWLLNMSGQACREFEIMSVLDFRGLFIILSNVNAIYTRLDIAIDDYANIFTVNQFRNAVYNKQCVTKLRSWGNHQRGLISTGNDILTMDSFYLGSRNSRYFLNVYNKKMEQAQKGFYGSVSWVRTELRLSYDYADMMILNIIQDDKPIGYYVKAFLNEKIVMLKPSALKKDDNRSRLAKEIKNHARWWRRFLNTVDKLHLTSYKPDKTIKDTIDWHRRQVSTSLGMLKLYKMDNYDDYIQSLTFEGLEKLKNHHIRKVLNQQFIDELNIKKRLKKQVVNKK